MNTKTFSQRVSELHEVRTKKIRMDLQAKRYADAGRKPRDTKDLAGFKAQLGSTVSVVEGLVPDLLEALKERITDIQRYEHYNFYNPDDGCEFRPNENGDYIIFADLLAFLKDA